MKSNPVSKIVGRMLGRCWANSKILGEYRVNIGPKYYAAWELNNCMVTKNNSYVN